MNEYSPNARNWGIFGELCQVLQVGRRYSVGNNRKAIDMYYPTIKLRLAREHQAELRREAENFRTLRKTKMDRPLAVNRMLSISATLAVIIVALVRFLG